MSLMFQICKENVFYYSMKTRYVIVCGDIDGLPPTKKPCIVQFEENVGREVTEKLAKEISSLRQSPFS